MKFDLEYLEKLANIVYENDLSEITLEDDEKAVCFKREKQQVVQAAAPMVMPATVTSQVVAPAPAVKPAVAEAKVESAPKGTPITAPMVGTFYAAPSPEAAPFVKVGDNVSVGQVVCIIEAMKLMNEIEAEVSGKITEICVKNGDAIEFGQVLMYVE
ncbi:MAG: acetyl-CoA carboxylase biotin carboxyl carrier protein [Candidatus Gastranaerophilales bacterium]|nr:acetyl-CoA carboxylase biotin carboxyl carrier protein [Candidatus Gastranaerophilales bacterium]